MQRELFGLPGFYCTCLQAMATPLRNYRYGKKSWFFYFSDNDGFREFCSVFAMCWRSLYTAYYFTKHNVHLIFFSQVSFTISHILKFI